MLKHPLKVWLALVTCCLTAVTAVKESAAAVTPELIQRAQSGDATAQFQLGLTYDSGRLVRRNVREAEKWYRASALQGNSDAQNAVGSMLQDKKNYSEALSWFEKAAASGHPQGTNNLGYLYDLGLGVAQDRQKGFQLYSRAAELGWAESMWNIANVYGAGQLGPVDYYLACVWTVRAELHAGPGEVRMQKLLENAQTHLHRLLQTEEYERCVQEAKQWNSGKPEAPAL